jgi:thiamine-monophosphate kinase
MKNAKGAALPRSEAALLEIISPLLPKPSREVLTGIGDDCAAIRPMPGGELQLLKTDALVEGIHFAPGTPPERVGWKALCRPLSDIAAMGGTPLHAMVTVAAPAGWNTASWTGLYRGIGKAARAHGVSVVGGETVRSPGPAFLSISLTGAVAKKRLKLRSGAKPRDLICVTGRLGGSFKSGRHLSFHPRLAEGQWLGSRKEVTSMMDLSDGLGSDLPKLATESRCSFRIVEESLPRNRGCSIASAIVDGEDYELLLTIAPDGWPALMSHWKKRFPSLPLTCIGAMGSPKESSTPLPSGYDRLANSVQTR